MSVGSVVLLCAIAAIGMHCYRKRRALNAFAKTSMVKIEELTSSSIPSAPPIEELEGMERKESPRASMVKFEQLTTSSMPSAPAPPPIEELEELEEMERKESLKAEKI